MRFTRRKRGRPFKSKPQDPPEFFKIYLPEHNSKKLLIPPAFLKSFKGVIPEKVVLKSSLGGNLWDIEVEKEEDRVLMTKGWESYVMDNALERGEFLVFRYDDNYEFTVKAFGISGCKKDESTTFSQHPVENVEPEDRPDEVLNRQTDACERNDRAKVTELVQAIRSPVFLRSPQEPRIKVEGMTGSNYEANNFRFVKVDDGKKRYELCIPGWIIKEHNVTPPRRRVPEVINLRNQTGLSLPGVLCQRSDRRVVLCGGWRKFYLRNRICKGDEYELEVALDERRKIKELIVVQISRRF